ncbi:MAG: hypothetical protein WC710_14810 [Gallionella sp.]|jgi:hypothetical protein
MTYDDRLTYLNATIAAMEHAWPQVAHELHEMIDDLTRKLINQNNDETRGAIKALQRVIVLPNTLASERDHIAAAQDE